MSDPYNQQKEDPQGHSLSLAFLAAMLGIVLLIGGGPAQPLGLVALIAAGVLYWHARS